MSGASQVYDEQAVHWNGRAGRSWVDQQELLDGMFRPMEELLVGTILQGGTDNILDVGCGTGGITLAAARRLGAGGTCVGMDISRPMIAAAADRAAREGLPAQFICADVQDHAFAPGGFDRIISRFGVMFFRDSVAAFRNLRFAVRPGGRMHFIAWRSPEENPFMTTAERAAAPLLDNLPARPRAGPGQFAFADPQCVQAILVESGWTDVEMLAADLPCRLPRDQLVRYFTTLGPVGLALEGFGEAARSLVVEAVQPAFDPYVIGNEVRFMAACWSVTARPKMS